MEHNPTECPTWDEFLRPLLELAAEEPIMRRTSVQKIADQFQFSEEIRSSRTKSGQPHIQNRADWSQRADIKAELKVALIILLAENGYPPITHDEVYKEIFEQAKNFKKCQGV